jgi:proteasome lid subunit RPN8/RPN11
MPPAIGNATTTDSHLRRGSAVGTLHDDAYTILIADVVLDEILEYSERDLYREVGGFLIGRGDTTPRPHVEICHFLPAVQAQSRIASLMFTHDTWAAMTRDVERKFPDEAVLGWHHTHPGFGVFLSAYDMFIHRNFFREPWQIALVVDPRRQELGFFQWSEDQVVDCGFVCTKGNGASEADAG